MALNSVAAAAAVQAWINATPALAADPVNTHATFDGLVAAIFDQIVANAVVTPTLLVAPSGGGPVTGTGTIT